MPLPGDFMLVVVPSSQYMEDWILNHSYIHWCDNGEVFQALFPGGDIADYATAMRWCLCTIHGLTRRGIDAHRDRFSGAILQMSLRHPIYIERFELAGGERHVEDNILCMPRDTVIPPSAIRLPSLPDVSLILAR
jgi:hypothetical protein